MAVITGIVPSPDQPGHVIILVDGAPFATVPAALAGRFTPSGGRSPDPLAPPTPAASPTAEKTWQRALGMLAYRACSAAELRRKLKARGEPEAETEAALARLRASGLIDDASFAAERTRSQVLGRAKSRRMVQQDLARRGVARDVAAAAVTRVLADEGTDEAAVAVAAARKKLRSLERLDPAARRQKLYAWLARQGFAFDAVRHALKVVLDAAPPDGAVDD